MCYYDLAFKYSSLVVVRRRIAASLSSRKPIVKKRALSLLAAMLCASLWADIPESVDVLVLGGTVRAVAAAVEAKKAGADVYLVAPRPYLGEDIAGKMRLKKPAGELGPICSAIYDPKGHEGSYAFGDTTPAQAKKALDRALLDAGVPFITWTIGSEVLKDAQGRDKWRLLKCEA